MAAENIKSTAITNLDLTPAVRTTNYGQRGQIIFSTMAVTTAKDTGSTYQLARLPSNAILHSLTTWLDSAVTTFTADYTLYYSDIAGDGTDANAGTGAVASHVFQTAKAMAAVVTPFEAFLGGNLVGSKLGQPLWQQAGLTSDPGGFFDVVALTTTTNSGTGVLNTRVAFGNN